MIDDRMLQFPVTDQAYVAQLCDRRFGIGADGLILLQPHAELGFFMKYYNADGNESSMCGNGGRCIAAFSAQLGIAQEATKFMAIDGPHDAIIGVAEKNNRYIKLKMKDVDAIEKRSLNTFVLDTGSPHYVQFIENNLLEMDIVAEAKKIRYNDEFAARGINVNFIAVTGATSIAIRTYERGVEDETLSCGTGVSAAAISLCLLKKLPSGHYIISVKVMGGDLKVSYDYDENTHTFSNIWLQGPAAFVYEGSLEV